MILLLTVNGGYMLHMVSLYSVSLMSYRVFGLKCVLFYTELSLSLSISPSTELFSLCPDERRMCLLLFLVIPMFYFHASCYHQHQHTHTHKQSPGVCVYINRTDISLSTNTIAHARVCTTFAQRSKLLSSSTHSIFFSRLHIYIYSFHFYVTFPLSLSISLNTVSACTSCTIHLAWLSFSI